MNAPQPASAFNGATNANTEPLYKISTTSLIRNTLIALCVTVAIFFISVSGILFDMRTTTRTILKDTAPSVVAAQQIKTSLANIDANAVNAALLRGADAENAWKEFELEQRILSNYLVTASQNITYGDAEKNPLIEIIASLQSYSDLIGQARVSINSNATTRTGKSGTDDTTLGLLRRASDEMISKMIPAANALNAANETVLDETWTSRNNHKIRNYIILLATSALVLIVLAVTQILVTRRTRRQINLGLLLATIVFAAGTFAISTGMTKSDHHLHVAKDDAFDSVRSLWKARSTAFSMNADESYYLLDPARKDQYTQSFGQKLKVLVGPDFFQPERMKAYNSTAQQMLQTNCKVPPKGGSYATPGLIGDELLNVTFDHECAEAANLVPILTQYVKIDNIIRTFEATGNHAPALAIALGNQEGQSNYVFSKFNQELGLLIDLNQAAFEDNAKNAISDISLLDIVLTVISLLTIGLAFLGLRPRLAEYHNS